MAPSQEKIKKINIRVSHDDDELKVFFFFYLVNWFIDSQGQQSRVDWSIFKDLNSVASLKILKLRRKRSASADCKRA